MILLISLLLLCRVYVFPAHTVAGNLRSVVRYCPLCHPSDYGILILNSSSIFHLVLNLRSFRIFSNPVCATKKAFYRPFFGVVDKNNFSCFIWINPEYLEIFICFYICF
jgi:hypothetical protein